MDDVEDSSLLRRGSPTAHTVFGIPHTINTSGYVYFLAYKELFKLRPEMDLDIDIGPSTASRHPPSSSPTSKQLAPADQSTITASPSSGSSTPRPRKDAELDRLVTEEMLALHRGQGLEIFWRDSLTCPSEEEYIKMVRVISDFYFLNKSL